MTADVTADVTADLTAIYEAVYLTPCQKECADTVHLCALLIEMPRRFADGLDAHELSISVNATDQGVPSLHHGRRERRAVQ